MMKKIPKYLSATLFTLLFSASAAFAQEVNPGTFTPEQPLTQDAINDLNPLAQFGDPNIDLSTPGAILSRVILFAFPIAGGILLIMLLWAGFEMVAGATEKKSQDAGRQRATAAVIGFILLFVSYWIIRLLELVTGAKIF